METIRFKFREPRPDDENGEGGDLRLIVNAWMEMLGDTRKRYEKHCGFWDVHKHVIASTLERSRVVVACDADNDGLVWGFGVAEPATRPEDGAIVHWVYVRAKARRRGIGSAILKELRKGFNHNVLITAATFPWIRQLAQKNSWAISELGPVYQTLHEQLKKAG